MRIQKNGSLLMILENSKIAFDIFGENKKSFCHLIPEIS